jgi:hypothetical protein
LTRSYKIGVEQFKKSQEHTSGNYDIPEIRQELFTHPAPPVSKRFLPINDQSSLKKEYADLTVSSLLWIT